MIKIKRIYAGIVAVAVRWRQPFVDRRGFLPFIAPKFWRDTMVKAIASLDSNSRILGAFSMFLGLMLLLLTRS